MMGFPLVLLHGASSGPREWTRVVSALDGYVDCKCIDLGGFDSISAMADAVLEETRELPKFALCGTSMGGYVALALARQAPDRILSLILTNTSARSDTPERRAERVKKLSESEADYFSRLADPTFPKLLFSNEAANDEKLLTWFVDGLLQAGPATSRRHNLACMNRVSSLEFLPSMGMPVLVIGADQDKLIPLDHQRELVKLIPNARLEIIQDCGHAPHCEKPAELAQIIKHFLGGLQVQNKPIDRIKNLTVPPCNIG